ncbi:MAG TPA: endonuclease/exonuclease/phosphatase family protein [Longimicrobiales bacterium]|nr:endonuclease/exonuclease/phosphatase family protein [Longimicrobiales bacterium]
MEGSPKSRLGAILALGVVIAVSGCVSTRSFVDVSGPRYAGEALHAEAPQERVQDVQVASFNLKYGLAIDGALELIRTEPGLADADVLLLQEMDPEGTREIAEALGMSWVYYPASLRNGREFGNAILSRWPIRDDEKLLLPHESLFGSTRRIATVATIDIHDIPVRVYSVHLATPVNQSGEYREDQWETVLDDASTHPHVIIGGDLNSHSLPGIAADRGYVWATREGPRTTWWARVDHILYRGMVPTWSASSGTVAAERVEGVSDHRPVWARARFRSAGSSALQDR